jgi:fumarate reductase flavoprotein subunit
MNTSTVLNRRSFVAGSAALASAAALAGVASAAEIEAVEVPEEDYAANVTETVDVDVVVVGSGVSGMAAGVQAAELGLKTLVIEASDIRGAVIRSTEGLAAVNSSLQQEQGIEISIPEVVKTESEAVQYRLNGLFWKELLERSGETIQWLADNGVSFTGQIDTYSADGVFPTFHWFPGDHEAQTYYGDPMEATLLGHENAELRLKTRGRELKLENGKVAGLHATTDEGVLEVNAPVVILATGGFGANLEEVARRFSKLPVGRYSCDGASTNVGDGTAMAISAGGVLDTMHTCFLGTTIGDVVNGAFAMNAINTTVPWINQDGQRFVDESVGGILSIPGINLIFHHDEIYALYDAALLGDTLSDAQTEVADNPTGVFTGETIEELAQALGVDPDTLTRTVEDYNAMVEAGEDTAFGKDLTGAPTISEPPFFAFRQKLNAHGNIGGLLVNLNYEVIQPDSTPVPGLYAVGTESNMNYREFAYSFTVPGGAMSEAVDSGRWAAKNAAQYLQA